MRARRRFAAAADLRTAHRVTRPSSFVGRKTASADKKHLGEATEQAAADHGIAEWSPAWRGDAVDHGESLARMVDDLYALGRAEEDAEEILLEPLNDEELLRCITSKFKGGTGVGHDWMRPRHICRLSRAARRALLRLLRAIEAARRWPLLLRSVIEIALGKKGGGARLVGQATAIYRGWAKLRFVDIRRTLEGRIARPYLPAAPGRGALHAAFDLSFDAEVAKSRGRQSASTCFDLKQYYEQVEVAEIARGCKRHGLPREIAALAIHMYMGPRRIRVGRAVSREVFPRRSILAGCTFALVLIRLIAIVPIDLLMNAIRARLKGWDADIKLILYVDDGIVSTYGEMDAVAILHAWVTRLVLDWVAKVLRKEVAVHKLACIAASFQLAERLRHGMAGSGIAVSTEGEILGVDFAAGGPTRQRRVQVKRRRKAVARKSRLRWWRASGGSHAHQVAKGGLLPTASYGDSVIGVTNAALRDYRKIHAASVQVQCAGSSITAKLAIGGYRYGEHDPAVLCCNPTLAPLLRKLWDQPQCRGSFVMSWRRTQAEVASAPLNDLWRMAGGPVMVTWLHFARIGIEWSKPFEIKALDHAINIITTPPVQVAAIVTAHARRYLDLRMLERLCAEHGWDQSKVMHAYRHGVDWDIIRQILRGDRSSGVELAADERVGLQLLVCGGLWPEHRRWRVGLRRCPSCEACRIEDGTEIHRVHGCGAMAADVAMGRADGSLPALPKEIWSDELAPLATLGLPPRPLPWEPVEVCMEEGFIVPEPAQIVYGDGSGYLQQVTELRRATWAIVTMEEADGNEACPQRARCSMRGVIDGWFPTVPRGELTALKQFLRFAGPGATFVSDCKAVADGVRLGIPSTLTAASHMHADLWRDVRERVLDREDPPRVLKTKAHRSRAAACRDVVDHEGHWWGNRAADIHAKQLAHRQILDPHLAPIWDKHRAMVAAVLKRAAFGVAWALKRWPTLERRAEKCLPEDTEGGDPEAGHALRRRADGAIECALCRLYVRSEDSKAIGKFRRQICGGSIFRKIDETHALRTSNGVTWCQRCGGFTSRWLRSLLDPCRGKPHTATRRNILRRLNAGLPPTAQEYLLHVAASSGNPEGAPDHQSITSWRIGGHDGPHSDGTRELSDGPRIAPPPKGIYSRLPASRRAAGGDDATETARRPQGDQRVTVASGDAQPAACNYDGSGGMARRIRAGIPGVSEPCNACAISTATVCRSCRAPLCITCARGKRSCRNSLVTVTAGEYEIDHDEGPSAVRNQPRAEDGSSAEASMRPAAPPLGGPNGPGGGAALLAEDLRRVGVAGPRDARECHRDSGDHRRGGSDSVGPPRADPRRARDQGSRGRGAFSSEAAAGDDDDVGSCHEANARRSVFLRSLMPNAEACARARVPPARGSRARSLEGPVATASSAPAACAPRRASLPTVRAIDVHSLQGAGHQQGIGTCTTTSIVPLASGPAAVAGSGHHHLQHHGHREAEDRCVRRANRQHSRERLVDQSRGQEGGPCEQAVVVAASLAASLSSSVFPFPQDLVSVVVAAGAAEDLLDARAPPQRHLAAPDIGACAARDGLIPVPSCQTPAHLPCDRSVAENPTDDTDDDLHLYPRHP